MSVKLLLGVLVLALLAGAGWYFRDNPEFRQWMRLQQQAAPFNGAVPSGAAQDAATAGLRKCRSGAKVVYTSGDCAKGSVEQPISGGAVTVVPSQPAGSPAKPEAPPDDANLSKRVVEKLIK
jgi:hypothetical protein